MLLSGRNFLGFFVWFGFGVHIQHCSGVIPGSEIRNHSWWDWETIWNAGNRTQVGHVQGKWHQYSAITLASTGRIFFICTHLLLNHVVDYSMTIFWISGWINEFRDVWDKGWDVRQMKRESGRPHRPKPSSIWFYFAFPVPRKPDTI